MIENLDFRSRAATDPMTRRVRRRTTFADVVGPERAMRLAQEKIEADRRIARRRRELGSSAWDLAELYGFRTIVPASDETAE